MSVAALPAVEVSRVEADRLVIALEHHVGPEELPAARAVVAAARHGRLELSADVRALLRRCLAREGNAPALLARVA